MGWRVRCRLLARPVSTGGRRLSSGTQRMGRLCGRCRKAEEKEFSEESENREEKENIEVFK